MSNISTRAAGELINGNGYNGNELQIREFSDGSGLEVYDFHARTYDPQIGRFIQIDPETEESGQESLTPYHFGINNPILYNDPDGRNPGPIIAGLYRLYRAYRAVKEIKNVINRPAQRIDAVNMIITTDALGNTTMVKEKDYMMHLLRTEQAKADIKKNESGKKPVEVVIDGNKYPEAAKHAQEALENGAKTEGVIDRKGRDGRRRENLKGQKTEPNKDRDEFPPAVIKTNGKVSVRLIDKGDNRGAGPSLGHQLQNLPDNTKINIRIIPPKTQ